MGIIDSEMTCIGCGSGNLEAFFSENEKSGLSCMDCGMNNGFFRLYGRSQIKNQIEKKKEVIERKNERHYRNQRILTAWDNGVSIDAISEVEGVSISLIHSVIIAKYGKLVNTK